MQRFLGGVELRDEAHDAVVCGAAAPAAYRDGGGVAAGPDGSGQRGDKVLAYLNGRFDGVLSWARPFSRTVQGGKEGVRGARVRRMSSVRARAGRGIRCEPPGNQNIEIAEAISSPGKGRRSTRDPGTRCKSPASLRPTAASTTGVNVPPLRLHRPGKVLRPWPTSAVCTTCGPPCAPQPHLRTLVSSRRAMEQASAVHGAHPARP